MTDRSRSITRRDALGRIAAAAAFGAVTLLPSVNAAPTATAPAKQPAGRLKQSLSRWTSDEPLPSLCKRLKAIGFAGVDLLYADEWATVTDSGLAVSMGYPSRRDHFIATGFNDPANHALLLKELETTIPLAKQAGLKNLITMFGNRRPGIDDKQAIDNCVTGLSKIAPLAAENGITICVELLNSKVDHHGYQGDSTAFGVAVMKGVNSPHVKLLYDIYHMQIDEGDVIRNIRDYHQYIAHYHTAGVPGRHEIDDSQELYYPAIMRAIKATGFQGFVAQEFIPTKTDKLASLREAVRICNV